MKSVERRTYKAGLRAGRTQGSGTSIVAGPAHGPAVPTGLARLAGARAPSQAPSTAPGRPQLWRGTAYRALVPVPCALCGRTVEAGELFSRRSGAVKDAADGRLLRVVCGACGALTLDGGDEEEEGRDD